MPRLTRRTRPPISAPSQQQHQLAHDQPHIQPELDHHHHHHHHHQAQLPPPSTFAAQTEADHIKIMLATDNHIGYMERDPVRGQDSIRTFEEILQLAVQHDVDLILLGGDLFHENKPSRATLHQTMALLRQYTLGDKPVSVELLSDPTDGALPAQHFPAINYEDPNLNVAIPVFSIHGNHDDPQGVGETGALSALDLLSVSGLLNYFGRIELPSDDAVAGASAATTASGGTFQEKGIRIKPVLLQKGHTKLALYGMGNIKDERMHFELRANRVRMYRPEEQPDSWFNMLCVHQNRVAHNPKACVPETMFDDSIHLVVWGHEHEQMIQPQSVVEKRYHITQPGSSIATSLCHAETVQKCVAIVHVENTDFLIEPIALQTVRPFVMDDMVLSDELQHAGLTCGRNDIVKLLRQRVDGLIVQAENEFKQHHPHRDMPLPLVRLRVEYTTQHITNPQRFGQEFWGKVANPKEVVQFTKRKSVRGGGGGGGGGADHGANAASAYVDVEEEGLLPVERLERVDVGRLVQQYLQAQNLDILNPDGLQGAVLNFVEKDDRDAIDSFVTKMLTDTVKGLVTIDPQESCIDGELERLRQQQIQQHKQQRHTMQMQMQDQGMAATSTDVRADDSADSMMDDEHEFDDAQSVASGRSGAARRGAAAGAARSGGARTAPAPTFLGPESAYADEADSDEALDERASTAAPPARRQASVLDMLNKRAPTTAASATSKRTGKAAQRHEALSIPIGDDDDDDDDDDDEFVEAVTKPTRRVSARR